MANRTAWIAGNGVGFTWTTAINSSDLVSMANGSSVLSSVTGIANQTNLDMFMDISVRCSIASSTMASGANLALWLYALLDDGSTYGDGQFTAGTQAAKTPTFPPIGTIPLVTGSAQTTLVGYIQQVIIPPGTFKLALQNNSGFAFTAGTQTVMYRTYNLNLNN
jgi:hypothetical protein